MACSRRRRVALVGVGAAAAAVMCVVTLSLLSGESLAPAQRPRPREGGGGVAAIELRLPPTRAAMDGAVLWSSAGSRGALRAGAGDREPAGESSPDKSPDNGAPGLEGGDFCAGGCMRNWCAAAARGAPFGRDSACVVEEDAALDAAARKTWPRLTALVRPHLNCSSARLFGAWDRARASEYIRA